MAQVTATNPVRVETKKVDGSGKVYVGNDLSGEQVEIIVSRTEEPNC